MAGEKSSFFTPEDIARFEALAPDELAKLDASVEGPSWPPGALTPDEILDVDLDHLGPTWLVPTVIPIGLVLLVAPTKTGKSIFATQLARSVAYAGVPFLGREPAVHGPVLYLSLDEPNKLTILRVHRQGWARGRMVGFYQRWYGGFPGLEETVGKVRPALVVIDTAIRFLGDVRVDVSEYAEVTRWLGKFHALTMELNFTILLVHHTRKGIDVESGDPFRDALGSQAWGAVPDAVIGIYRQRTEPHGYLVGGGRFGEDFRVPICLEPDTFTWRKMDPIEVEAAFASSARKLSKQGILEAVPDDSELKTEDISDHAGVSLSYALRILGEFEKMGIVRSRKDGKARLWTRKVVNAGTNKDTASE